jgi:hypothetical protein
MKIEGLKINIIIIINNGRLIIQNMILHKILKTIILLKIKITET